MSDKLDDIFAGFLHNYAIDEIAQGRSRGSVLAEFRQIGRYIRCDGPSLSSPDWQSWLTANFVIREVERVLGHATQISSEESGGEDEDSSIRFAVYIANKDKGVKVLAGPGFVDTAGARIDVRTHPNKVIQEIRELLHQESKGQSVTYDPPDVSVVGAGAEMPIPGVAKLKAAK